MVKAVAENGLAPENLSPTQPVASSKPNAVPNEVKESDCNDIEVLQPTQPISANNEAPEDIPLSAKETNNTIARGKGHRRKRDDDDDELVELSLSRVVKKSQITAEDIQNLIVKCTACASQVNHHDSHRLKKHLHLGVLVCKDCYTFYGKGEFSEDEDGDKYCRWCAQGGIVFGCDYCRNVFCSDCIRRNFGRGEVRRIQDADWKCYACDPAQIKEKVAYCDLILEYSRSINKKAKRKLEASGVKIDELKSPELDCWLSAAFGGAVCLASKLTKKVEKLRQKYTSSEKTPKQIVTKFEQVMAEHRQEIKCLMGSVAERYRNYSQMKLAESLQRCSEAPQKRNTNIPLKEDTTKKNTPSVVGNQVVDENLPEVKSDISASANDKVPRNIPTDKQTEENSDCKESPKSYSIVGNKDSDGDLAITKIVIKSSKLYQSSSKCRSKEQDSVRNDVHKNRTDDDAPMEIDDSDTVVIDDDCKVSEVQKSSSSVIDADGMNNEIPKPAAKDTVLLASALPEDSEETITPEHPETPKNDIQEVVESAEDESSTSELSSEASTLPNDSDSESRTKKQKRKQSQKKKSPQTSMNSSLKHAKKSKSHKLVLCDATTSYSDSSDFSDGKQKQKKVSEREGNSKSSRACYFTPEEIAQWNVNKEEAMKDPKLSAPCYVVVHHLDMGPYSKALASMKRSPHSNAGGNTDESANAAGDSDEWSDLDKLEHEVDKLCKSSRKRQKKESKNDEESEVSRSRPVKAETTKPEKEKKKANKSSSSDAISLSSSENEKIEKILEPLGTKVSPVKAMNLNSKKKLLDEQTDVSSSSEDVLSGDDFPRKKKGKKNSNKREPDSEGQEGDESSGDKKYESSSSGNSGVEIISSDSEKGFVPKKKKRKPEKLLRATVELSDDDDFQSETKQSAKAKDNEKRRKSAKRKIIYSDEEDKKGKASNESTCTTESDSESNTERKKRRKGKGRKRIKVADSSEEEETKKKTSGDDEKNASTPGKGRKNIRKVISHRKLTEETRAAQDAEKERRKRIAERQKLYNKIVEDVQPGHEAITKKFVLEVDPESKEEVVEIHPDIVEKLKPHQVNGVKFMWECTIESLKRLETEPGSGCILAHCMGLGKTLQVIAFLYTLFANKYVSKKIRTAMVICPYNTVLNWINEFSIWLQEAETTVPVFDISSIRNNHGRLDHLREWHECGGVLVIGYNMFSRLAEGKLSRTSKKVKENIMKYVCDPGPDIVVCDEGHMLKNENSALSKAASKLKTQRRIVLTGTPLQNNLKEYHVMMHFVKPNLLGTAKEFTNRFVNPIINGQYDDSSKYDVQLMKKRVHILHKLLEGCVQRCDYSALTKCLPPKHEYVISVKLSEVQIKLYRHYLENFSRSANEKVDGGKLFQDYNVLKNIWTFPYILHLDHARAEKRGYRSEDSFIDDDSYDSGDSFINDSSDNGSTDEPKAGPSKPQKNDDSEDEVIRKYKTRRHCSDNDDIEEEEIKPKQWWDDFFSEEEKFKIELSGKMVLIIDILKECETIGDKVLIFSQSLLALDMMEMLLAHLDEQQSEQKEGESTEGGGGGEATIADSANDSIGTWVHGIDYFRMDGSTNVETRKHWIELFNDLDNPKARLFLISTKAGSLGTNLVGANRVIVLDASWNPSHDVQAIFRVYRFGQLKPVYIYRLLAQGTMEEKIYNRQVTKLSLSCRVVDEQQIDRHFNASQLAELYTFEPDSRTDRPTPMVPKDRLLADLLIKHSEWIVTYHEHDSLLQCSTEDDLTEEERQAAWAEYENEKEGIFTNANMDYASHIGPQTPGSYVPDMDNVVKVLITESRRKFPEITNVELMYKVSVQLSNLRNYFMQEHVKILRQKQDYVSKGMTVPQVINGQLENLETSLSKTTAYLEQFKKQLAEEQKRSSNIPQAGRPSAQSSRPTHQQPRPQQPIYTIYRPGYGPSPQYPHATYYNAFRPSGQRPTFNPGFTIIRGFSQVPTGSLPKQSSSAAAAQSPQTATIVDISNDKETVVTTSTVESTPIVTEADDGPEDKGVESKMPEVSSSVKITEIEGDAVA